MEMMRQADLRWLFISDFMLISFYPRIKAFNVHHICSRDSYLTVCFMLAFVHRKAVIGGGAASPSHTGAVSC